MQNQAQPGVYQAISPMRHYHLRVLVLLGIIGFPCYARADAGTPLMWAGMLHLVLGNAFIGTGEGMLLAWLFSVPQGKCVAIMIPANYASAWLGGLFIRGKIVQALPMDLNNGWQWFWIMVVVTYLMTLIIEWPFVVWCLWGKPNWLKRSLVASLVVQSASYALLFGWYWLASGTSLYTKLDIVPPANLSLPDSVLVYYIGPGDGNVYQRPLAGPGGEMIYALHSKDNDDRLVVRPNPSNTNHYDVIAPFAGKNSRDPLLVDVQTNLPVDAVPDLRSRHISPPQYEGTWFNFGEVPRLGSATNSHWKFRTGFWSGEGLLASDKSTGQSERFSYETPFGAWDIRNAVQLPSDKVLFQLGDDQICIFDPISRQVALLWHGRGPVAVLEPGLIR